MPNQEVSPGLLRVAIQQDVVESVKAKVDDSKELHKELGKATPTNADIQLWEQVQERTEILTDAFKDVDLTQSEGLLLVYELLSNQDIDQTTLNEHLARVDAAMPAGSPQGHEERVARTIALIKTGLAILRTPDTDAVGGVVRPGDSAGGEGGGLFNTMGYAHRLKRVVKGELRKAARVDSAEIREITVQEGKRRINRLLASMFLNGDREDMPFVFMMKQGEKTFGTLSGDWVRDMIDSVRKIDAMAGAMKKQMSTDNKRAEEITSSGIEDVDFVKMLAYKFPFTVKYEDAHGVEREKTLEASVWDVVEYLYGMKKVQQDPCQVYVERRGRNDGTSARIKIVHAGEAEPKDTSYRTYEKIGDSARWWTAGQAFTAADGTRYEKGATFLLESLSNQDMARVNAGELRVYPKLRTDVFAPEPQVPGSDLLVKRASDIAKAGNWGYFETLLKENGIEINKIKDFINPFDDIGLNDGLAGDLGADWMSNFKDWDTNPDKGKLLTIRNLAAGMAPIFTAGKTMAQVMGHEMLWNPTYDNSRVMRLIENTLLADAYDWQKGVSPFGFKTEWLSRTYGTYTDRMAKKHPIETIWGGTEIDMADRVDPWEDGLPPGVTVSLKPIDLNKHVPGYKDNKKRLEFLRFKAAQGATLTSAEKSEIDRLFTSVQEVDNKLAEQRQIDQDTFLEQVFEPGVWEEKEVLNYIVTNARRKVLNGEATVEQALEWARTRMEQEQLAVFMNPKAKKMGWRVVRHTSSVIARAIGLPKAKKEKIADRPLFDTIYGLAATPEAKENYQKLNETRPEMFKGIMGSMVLASELMGLKHIDFGIDTREIEAWVRYLCYNASAYSKARALIGAATQTQIDPEKVRDMYFKTYRPEDAAKGYQQRIGSWLVERAQEVGFMEELMKEAELQELMKALQALPYFVMSHADLNQEQKRHLYIAYVYILEGYLESGVRHVYRSREAEARDGGTILPSDHQIPLTISPENPIYDDKMHALDQGLLEITMEGGWRVDFNAMRKHEGRVLLQGGGMAHSLQGYINKEANEWRIEDLHRLGRLSRPVDVYGMARLGANLIGTYMMRLGSNAEILTAEDVVDYTKEAERWFQGNDAESAITKR